MVMRVFVYFNLHRKLFSVREYAGTRRVLFHTWSILLRDCEFRVSQAGRERVLREQRKNVHAGVVGEYIADTFHKDIITNGTRISYNPYRFNYFYNVNTLDPVLKSTQVGLIVSYDKPKIYTV
jgi:hypothetical protein